jgi:hypothetical protein
VRNIEFLNIEINFDVECLGGTRSSIKPKTENLMKYPYLLPAFMIGTIATVNVVPHAFLGWFYELRKLISE